MDVRLWHGFAVLTAIASGADEPSEVAATLGLPERSIFDHLESLTAAGFIRREGERLLLTERLTALLGDLAGRSDLVGIAGPTVLDAEARLGVGIEIEVTDEVDPIEVVGHAPFMLRTDAGGRRQVVACVVDHADEIACLLRADVEGMAPEAIEVIGKELAVAADSIAEHLPRLKDRGRPRGRRP